MMSRMHLHLFVFLHYVHLIAASFTLPTSYDLNTVQQNAQKTWCYFPAVAQTTKTSCTGDFTMVSLVHLNTTTSIGYYGPDNTRHGGAEWAVPPENPGRVTLCVSGRAQDGTYQTACMTVTQDNSLPIDTDCWIAVGQKTVTDGCYLPGQTAFPTASGITTTGIGVAGTGPRPSRTSVPSLSTSYRLGYEGRFSLLAIAVLAVSVVANAIS